jgi:type 1 fimbriae regulatory protein FimB
MARPSGTKRKEFRRYLFEDEWQAFLKELKDFPLWNFLFSLTLYLGLRVKEVGGLRLQDINFKNYSILIYAAKKGLVREYKIPGIIWRKLERYLKERNSNPHKDVNSFLFPSRKYYDQHIELQTIKTAFKTFAKKAGLSSYFSVHSLRHTCGCTLAKNGLSAFEIQSWLRQRNINSAIAYVQLQGKDL